MCQPKRVCRTTTYASRYQDEGGGGGLPTIKNKENIPLDGGGWQNSPKMMDKRSHQKEQRQQVL
jgi:hypothetical protein